MGAKEYRVQDAFYLEKCDEILLISIQPRFSELIRRGVKTVELRKRCPKKLSKIAIVYESFPKKRATFLIKIKKVDAAPTKVIWERYRKKCAITKECFNAYYSGSKQGVAFIIDKVMPLDRAIGRELLTKYNLTPPQDYRYASREAVLALARSR